MSETPRVFVRWVVACAVALSGAGVVASDVTIHAQVHSADLVFDPVGGPTFTKLVEATAKGGLLILYGAFSHEPTTVPPFPMLARNLTIRGLNFTAYSADAVHLAAFKQFVTDGLADGSLPPVITRTFAFADIVDAHRFMEAGRQIGKIVARVG